MLFVCLFVCLFDLFVLVVLFGCVCFASFVIVFVRLSVLFVSLCVVLCCVVLFGCLLVSLFVCLCVLFCSVLFCFVLLLCVVIVMSLPSSEAAWWPRREAPPTQRPRVPMHRDSVAFMNCGCTFVAAVCRISS